MIKNIGKGWKEIEDGEKESNEEKWKQLQKKKLGKKVQELKNG